MSSEFSQPLVRVFSVEIGERMGFSRQAFIMYDYPVRFLLVSGRPLKEPVAWHGPIVMNNQEELDLAFEEYRNGTFIKHR